MGFCLGPPDSAPDPIYLEIGKLQDEMLKFDFLMFLQKNCHVGPSDPC